MTQNLFRVEIKIPLTNFETSFFFKKLKEYNFEKKFSDRVVNSIYFENNLLSIFRNSEEGILPRKKIRIRNYPKTNDKKLYFEKKISSIEGRYKEVKEISKEKYNEYCSFGIIDNIYGVIKPKISIKYTRSYFENKHLRVTFDRNISYAHYDKDITSNDHFNIFEVKSKNNLSINSEFIDEFQIRRFSKYCNGIKKLNIN
jgi:ubiquitin